MENGFWDFKKEKISDFFVFLNELLNLKLFSIGDSALTIGLLITLIISVVILLFLSEWKKNFWSTGS